MSTPRPSSSSRARGSAAPTPGNPNDPHAIARDDVADLLEPFPIRPPPVAFSTQNSASRPIRSSAPSPSDSGQDLGEIHPLHPRFFSSTSPQPPSPPAYTPVYDDPLRMPQRPWTGDTLPSRPSSEYAASVRSEGDSDDRVHLTSHTGNLAGAPAVGLGLPGHVRTPSRAPGRPYDHDGRARAGPLGIITRSPTIRRVSTTLRNASIRVVNIMGNEKEKDGYEGLTRLSTNEENVDSLLEMSSAPSTPPDPPTPPPPLPPPPLPVAAGLRGRTLGIFSATNPVRVAMNRLLLFSWTEPTILVLIMANVVILTFQSAPPLFTPRSPEGRYFRGWEDYALFALFIVFTVEMFARIVVTGLFLDPETSIAAFFRRAWDFAVFKARVDIDPATKQARKEPWHRRKQTSTLIGSRIAKQVMLSEAPFEEAVMRQRGLIIENRPYLRHSWHRIDMVAVVAFWITFVLAMTKQEVTDTRHLYLFRALSILRTTRLLVITSGTATILHSLKRAGPLILKVASFIVFAAALFSIIGVQSFRGSLRRTCILTDPYDPSNTVSLNSCGGHLNPLTLANEPYLREDGTPSTISPKGYICPLNQVCNTNNQSLNDNSESFDNIFKSLVQVLIIAGVNTWTSTMYETMDSDFFSSTLFFIVAIIVLNFWLMNLLVAVVVNTFQDIRADTKKSAFGADNSLLAEPEWAQDSTKKPKEPSRLFKWYRKTELFWVLLIVIDLIAQATKSAKSSPEWLNVLRNMEIAFALVWVVEIVIRMAAYTPDWRSFIKSGRNDFDLGLTIGCAIIQIPPIRNSTVYPWFTIFQLLRWYRVILVVPRMKPLLVNVFGSFTGLLNMVFFLFLMTFLAALMAVQFLRGNQPDENTINFSQAYNSFLGMYQIFSTENWTEVLYNSLAAEWDWGQGWIVCIFLFLWFLFANFIMMQMFIAVINENFSVAEEQKRKQQIESFIRKTEPVSAHVSWIERLNPYRLIKGRHKAVRVKAVPQNLILPLKQSIGADVGAPDMDEEEATGKAAMKRLFGIAEDGVAIPLRTLRKNKTKAAQRHSTHLSKDDDSEDDRGLTDLLPPLNPGISVDEHKDALRERRNQQADFISAHPSYDKSLWLFSQKSRVRQICQSLTPPAHGQRIFGQPAHPIWSFLFRVVVFLSVVASIVIAAIATPQFRKEYYLRHGLTHGWFDISEAGIGLVFASEAFIKIIADGFIFAPNAYLLSVWNVVDFVILLALVVNSASSLIVIGGVNRATRALKAFRALRLITLFARLRDTFHVVFFAGFVRIMDASVLMILYLIPFAVWGLNIFARRLTSCNDGGDNIGGIGDCVGEFIATPIDGSLGFLAPRSWANPTFTGSEWSFDNFRAAILILFEIVSLEGWTDVMASVMNIVGLDEQPQTNASQWNAIFFIIFNLFGGVIILTVFLTIIIENFSIASGTALLTAEQRQWVDLRKYIRQQTPSRLPKKKPRTPLRLWCYRRATTKRGYWARFFTFLYFVHIFLLMTEDYSDNIMTEPQLDLTFLVLTVLYAVDLVVRFIGLGPKSFRSNGWNLFDVIVITGSFATTIPALQASASGVEGNQASKQVQKLFLVAVALKLVQRLDSLNQLFKTSVASLPAIGNLFLLWAVLFIFAAIVYVEVFGLTKQGPSASSRFQNYHTFSNALVMLAFMSTGEGWNGFMHDYTVEFPRCTEANSYLESDCGSVGWAFSLFIAWNILSMYIFLNMFTGVVVQSFSYVYQMPGSASLDREQMRSFKHAWSQIDVNRTGYIRRKDCSRFFSMLNGVFEVRLYPTEYSVPHLLRACAPSSESAKGVVHGAEHAVEVNKLRAAIGQIDYAQVRKRRRQFVRLFYEAKITEEPRGISFTNMLLMLSHTTLINHEDALQVDELLVRRAKMERVDDLVNLDRVRGLLRTIYWRGKFQDWRAERARAAAEAAGYAVPAIVLPEMSSPNPPRTPSLADEPLQPVRSPWGTPTHTPPGSRPGTPTSPRRQISLPPPSPTSPQRHGSLPTSPRAAQDQLKRGSGPYPRGPPSRQGTGSSGPSRQGTLEADYDVLSAESHFTLGSSSHWHATFVGSGGITSLAGTGTMAGQGPGSHLSHVSTLGPSRRGSADSGALSQSASQRLSNYSAHSLSREPSFDEPSEDVLAAMATSVWGDMMREAVEDEDGDLRGEV